MKKFDLIWIPQGLAFLIALASSGIIIFYLFYDHVFVLLLIPIIHWTGFFVSLYAPKWLGKGFLYLVFCLGIILGFQLYLIVATNGCSEATGFISSLSYIFYFFIVVTSILFFVFLRKKKEQTDDDRV